jgi:hypothetical protein
MGKIRDITLTVKTVFEILRNPNLKIPEYQRPYKWERRNIRNLFYDIREAINKNWKEYRIGSIIMHHNNKQHWDIVDGQQRLISISLFLYYCYQALKIEPPIGSDNLLKKQFGGISQYHAKENFNEWSSLCSLISDNEVRTIRDYLIKKCKISVIEMPSDRLSEAIS